MKKQNRRQLIIKIILWLLFWYYLIPYYLLKKFVFQKMHHPARWATVTSLLLLFWLFGSLSGGNDNDEKQSTSAKSHVRTHYIVKKVGQKELKRAQSKHQVLIKESVKEKAEYRQLKQQLTRAKHKAAVKRQKENEIHSAAVSNNAPVIKQHHFSKQTEGNLNTAKTGRIVGNRNSHIYHVPGQAGYRMNSANAVYFNSEQAAQAAGYRKAKR